MAASSHLDSLCNPDALYCDCFKWVVRTLFKIAEPFVATFYFAYQDPSYGNVTRAVLLTLGFLGLLQCIVYRRWAVHHGTRGEK